MAMNLNKLDLHGLPLETLQQIAGHLHRPSLYSFGLASATCYRATHPFLFHHIHLTVSSREALRRNVDALVRALSRNESACYIRHLSIKGSFRLSSQPRIEGYRPGARDLPNSWFEATGVGEILGDEEPYLDVQSPHSVYDEPAIAKSSDEDLAWAPVVDLVKKLPHLVKLIYDCRNQFPPSLLDALHDYHPQCKLYHLTFRFRTLLWGKPYPYEMALATSPCLYSVKVECCWRDSEGDDDFNQEAMMELVAGLAPNLEEVVVVMLRPENWLRYWLRPREPWRGLPGFVSGRSIGSLTSLSLLGVVSWPVESPGLLQTWARHTDFSRLRHLVVGGGYRCESSGINDEVMEWLAQNCSFPRVKTLRIRMDRNENFVLRPSYANNAIALLGAFEPLDELSVSGPLEPKILDAILCQHGQTLKKLNLCPLERDGTHDNYRGRLNIPMTATKEHVLQINALCPALQELAISVKRTKSDALEAEIYKGFGKMGRLKSLFLTLDCSDYRLTRDPNFRDDESFDAADLELWREPGLLKKGHVRETLMNCAVDETLARAIWETICQSKAGQKLESLKLWTTGGGHWGNYLGDSRILDVVDNLSRSWLIERVAQDDENIINVRELGRRAREVRDQARTDRYKRHMEYLRNENDRSWLTERIARDEEDITNARGLGLGAREVCDQEVTDSYKWSVEYLGERKDIVMELSDVAEKYEAVRAFRRVWPRKKGSKDWREDWSSIPLQV